MNKEDKANLKEFFQKRNKTFGTDSQMQRRFLDLFIFYESIDQKEITEKAKMSGTDFISATGGILGLFLGLSLLSLVEIFEFLYELLHIFLMNFCKSFYA